MTEIFVNILLLLGGIWSYTTGKLTLTGSLTGTLIGFIIFKGAGLACFCMLTFFFIVGSAATKWQRDKKALMNAADTEKGRRTAAQVLANSGVAAILSLLNWDATHFSILPYMIAGSFAAATADTLSSELGTVYGRRFYNVITFKPDTRGLDGVISLEGTLIGIAGAFAIAVIHALFYGWNILVLWIVIAGFTGNLFDSVLGATLERRGWISNNMVNFLNTAVGAIVCWLLLICYFVLTHTVLSLD